MSRPCSKLAVVGPRDRALLPLPLHHAYPFVVGMLTTLSLGTTIVLPGSTTGPALMRALREANVTTIIGVPRLYEALWAAIEARLKGYHLTLRLAFRTLLKVDDLCSAVERDSSRMFSVCAVRHGIAPGLRLLVSGGARLEREDRGTAGSSWLDGAVRIWAGGNRVTVHRQSPERSSSRQRRAPARRRRGSNCAHPTIRGSARSSCVEARSPEGYLNNPEANQAAFTSDGWFRTGDLGFIDPDGFLFVTGRTKEVLVLGGGKKVIPEDLERIYGSAPEISEIAVLEDRGTLVALVRPDAVKLRQRGATNLRDGVRVILGEQAQHLPSYERLSGFALTDQPLPRTRLGKYRRFLLPMLYAPSGLGRPKDVPSMPWRRKTQRC